jgi:outer membrane lipoprotein LolB
VSLLIRLVCILFALFLSACTTITNTAPSVHSATTAPLQPFDIQAVKSLTDWQLKGKIAVQTTGESGSAMAMWTQHQKNYTLSLSSPLGTPALQLVGRPGRVVLTTSDGKQFTAPTPEELLAKGWGWNLPVSYLQYWIRGLPVPHVAVTMHQYDHLHRLSRLLQANWTIQFLAYMRIGKIDLPSRLSISSGAFNTKIIIYEWKIR